VGRLLEGCRKEAHGGTVPLQGRVKLVQSDSVAFSRRSANLQQQHAAINIEIAYMRQLEALKPLTDLANTTIFENAELLSMNRKRSSSRLSFFPTAGTDTNFSRLKSRTMLSLLTAIDVPSPPRYTPPMLDGPRCPITQSPIPRRPINLLGVLYSSHHLLILSLHKHRWDCLHLYLNLESLLDHP
jgi:hypothetical protein